MKKILFIITLGILNISAYSQINTNTTPTSFAETSLSRNFDIEVMPSVDVSSLLAEDAYNETNKIKTPWRFGYNIDTNINMNDYGNWEFLVDGSAIWRLGIESKGAFSINLGFDKFWMPYDAELYIYSADKSQILGAFTHENNSIDSIFSTLLIKGDKIIIEYYQPANVQTQAVLNINRVTHGYKNAIDYTKSWISDFCMINSCCPEGNNWEDQIKSVCMIVVNGNGFCTGTLMNNTNNDETPYILTSNYCYSDPSYWVFWFNWESETCIGSNIIHYQDAISGSTLVAKETQTDFCLVQMNSNPPSHYNVYYSGWDKSDSIPILTATIHHPSGGIKKISLDFDAPISDDYLSGGIPNSDWRVLHWNQGSVDKSSFGAGLWDQNKRLVGTYRDGFGSCTVDASSWFSKFSYSWNTGTTPNTRLSDWLDPIASGTDTLDGYDPNNNNTTNDIRPCELINPQSSYCSVITSITPEIVIQNMGSSTLTSANINIQIGSTSPITVAWTGTLSQNEKDTIIFPNININSGNTQIYFYTDSPNNTTDELLTNDTIILNLQNGGHSLTYFEHFQGFTPGVPGVFINGWSCPSSSIIPYLWCVGTSNTPSGGTGPSFDHTYGTSTGIYIYAESDAGYTGATTNLESHCINMNNAINPVLSFWYHMYGSDMGSLYLDICVDDVWINNIWSMHGEQHTSSSANWSNAIIDLTNYNANELKLRFRAIRGSWDEGDIALDDIYIRDTYVPPTVNDAGISKIINPEINLCGNYNAIIPTVVLQNFGTSNLTSVDIKYSINTNTPISYSWTGNLASGESDTVDLASIILPTNSVTFSAYTETPNSSIDENIHNDTTIINIENFGITAPMLETFETFTVSTSYPPTPGALNNGWTSERDVNFVWCVDRDGTPSPSTGPAFDHTLGNSSGIYLFTEASGTNADEECLLISPCIDLGSLQNPTLVFWYHMYGAYTGTLFTEVFINNAWFFLDSISGQHQTSETDPWLSDTINLSAVKGEKIKIRFRGVSMGMYSSDIAIDDIAIFDNYTQTLDDASIIEIIDPIEEYCFDTNPINPSFILQNVGANNLTSATITYELGPGNTYSYNWTGNLITYQTDTIIFSSIILPDENSQLTAYSSLPNGNIDQDFSNDTSIIIIDNGSYIAPFIETFETFNVGTPGGFFRGWFSEGYTGAKWVVNNGPTPTPLTGPAIDHTLGTSNGIYVYYEPPYNQSGNDCNLISSCIDLSTLQNPTLVFWYHMYGSNIYRLITEIFANNTWTQVDQISGAQQSSGTDPWLSDTIDLSAYAGQIIKIKFYAISGALETADMAIDNIEIFDNIILPPVSNDAGITEILNPEKLYCGQFTSITPQVVLNNYGALPLTSVDIKYSINNGIPVTYSWTGNLAFGEKDTVNLSTTNIPIGNSIFKAYTNLPNLQLDEDLFNDETSIKVNNFQISAPFMETFETSIVGVPGDLNNGWCTDKDSILEWVVDSAGTPSVYSGPSLDHTLGTQSGTYIYTKAAGSTYYEECSLISPCIDLNTMQNPTLVYWYHMLGRYAMIVGDLYTEIYTNNSWEVINVFNGRQQQGLDPWFSDTINLSAYAGQNIRIRFRSNYAHSGYSNIAIDDVSIYNSNSTTYIDFEADITNPCINTDVQLTNLCSGIADTLKWTITPNTFSYIDSTSSTSDNPKIQFNASGFYNVKLTIRNQLGVDSLTKVNYIEATEYGTGIFPFTEDFESADFATNNWQIINQDNNITWEIDTLARGIPQSTASVYINIYSHTANGTKDYLQTPVLDLTNPSITNPKLSFKRSCYGLNSSSNPNILQVAISDNCETTWEIIWSKDAYDLNSTQSNNAQYTPNFSSEWVEDTISLLPYLGKKIKLAFINIEGSGNNLFLDDININNFYLAPTCIFNSSIDTVCPGELVYFTDHSTDIPTQWYWIFNGSDTINSTLQNPSTTWSNPGTYDVTLIASNAYGGTSFTKTIVVKDIPIVYAGADQTICSGETVSLYALGGTEFLWSQTGETTAQIFVNPLNTTTYTVNVSNGVCWNTDEVTVNTIPLPFIDAGPDRYSCLGASITLNASGSGTFLWNTGSTNNSITIAPTVDTSYYLTVTGNYCSNNDTVNITMVTEPPADAGQDQTICLGDYTTLTASGGDIYTWSNGANGQTITVNPTTNTSYIVTVSIGGICSATDTVDVNVISSITANAGQDVTICEGESIQLIASGGDTYMWSNGQISDTIFVSPTTTTTYNVTVSFGTSGNCIDIDDVVVNVNPLPISNLGPDQTICSGQSVILTANSSSNDSYLWSNGATTPNVTFIGNTNTNYSVTITNTNTSCFISDTVNLSVNQTQYVDLGPDTTICKNQYLVVNAPGSGWTSYLWSSGQTQNYTYISYNTSGLGSHPIGLYVTDSNYCPSRDTIIVTIDDCIGIGEFDILSNLSIYPNPARTSITISYNLANDNNLILDIYDAKGSLTLSRAIQSNIGEHSETINIKNFPSGIYYIKINGNEFIRTEKLIIE